MNRGNVSLEKSPMINYETYCKIIDYVSGAQLTLRTISCPTMAKVAR